MGLIFIHKTLSLRGINKEFLSFMLHFAPFFSYLVTSLQEQTPFPDFPPLADKSDCSCSLSEASLQFFQWYQCVGFQINSPKSFPCRWPDWFFLHFLVSINKKFLSCYYGLHVCQNRRIHCIISQKVKGSYVGSSNILFLNCLICTSFALFYFVSFLFIFDISVMHVRSSVNSYTTAYCTTILVL